ncbi:PqqD family protein [Candidatus Margulisiibacteriota bacterium]
MKYIVNTDSVVHSNIDQETLLINMDSGFYYSLDKIGSFIWENLTQNTDFENIVSNIIKKFKVDNIIAEKDLKYFMQKLSKENIIITK